MKQLFNQRVCTPCLRPGSSRFETGKLKGVHEGDKPALSEFLRIPLLLMMVLSGTLAMSQSITGTMTVCAGSATTLSYSSGGGVWSSGNTAVALVGTGSGVVTGVSTGTASISYTVSGTTVTAVVTVNPKPSPGTISGPGVVCILSTITLSSTVSGGVWTANNGIATVGSSSGIITGVAAGIDTIKYMVTNSYGCVSNCAATSIAVAGITSNIYTHGGTGSSGYSGDGGPASLAGIASPGDVSTDSAGNIYFCDISNNRIRKISPSGIITTIAGNGTAGNTGDGGAATAAELNRPNGIFADNAGNVFICNTSSNTIRKVDASGIITTIAGTGSSGSSGDGGPATAATFYLPLGILEDASGNIYICDQMNNKVRKIAASSGIVTTVAGTGSAGYSGDGGAASIAQLHIVRGLAADNAGNIYIADAFNNVIRKYVPSTGTITTFAGTGIAGHTGDNGPATAAKLNQPARLAYDGANILYVNDQVNAVIRQINLGTGIISAVAGNGTIGYGGDYGAASSGEFHGPVGIGVDHSGNCFIADGGNNRIRHVPTPGSVLITLTGSSHVFSGTPITMTSSLMCPGSTITYQWQKNGSNVGGGTCSYTNSTPANGDVYMLVATVTPPCSAPVTDTSNCIHITVCPTAAPISGAGVVCTGSTTTLTDTSTGGTWSSSTPAVGTISATGVFSGLSSGTTTVSYTLTSSCGANTAQFTISVQDVPVVACAGNVTHNADPGSCNAVVNYTAATATGTSPSITYTQNSGTTFPVGVTTVTATATNGCGSSSCNFNITVVPHTMSISATNTNVTCFGNNNGTITTTANGGTGSYSYSWTGGLSGANPSGLAPGTYSVTVTDAGCAAETPVSTSATITQPSVLSASSSAGTITCHGGTTTVSVSAAGGTTPYSGTATYTVSAGTYSYTVTDANSCTATTTVTVTQPAALSVSPISGPGNICLGTSATLTDPTSGGSWSSSDPAIVSVDDSGSITGVSGGTTVISYAASALCGPYATYTITATPMDTISVTADTNGTVDPAGPVYLCEGSQSFTIVPDSGYNISNVIIDGASVGAVSSYTFPSVSGNHSVNVSFAVACVGPSITCAGDISQGSDSGSCGAVVTYGAATATGTSPVITYSQASGTYFPVGTTLVSAIATDGCGADTCIMTVIITDDQNPTITAPADKTANTDPGACSTASVSLGTPVTADNCTVASVTNNGTPPFAIGTTFITWTVTDASGNTSNDTQSVIISDNQAPTITAPSNVTVNADAGLCSAASVSLGTPVTADNCGVATVTSNAAPPYAVGNTVITWTVTDTHGNTATTTQTVTVVDNQNPTITAPANRTVNADPGSCAAATVSLGSAITSDNCGVASVTNDATPPYAVGNTVITWTATDIHGNTATKTQTVTVVDNQNPTITAPSNVTASGSCSPMSVSIGSATTSDNCGVASVTNDAPSLFPVGTTLVTWAVTDIHGNSATATQTVTVTGSITLTETAQTNVSCPGGANGSITTSISGGTTPYTYAWSNGASTSNISSLSAGTFSVTATDAHGCKGGGIYTITQPATLSLAGTTTTNVTCHGSSNGAITTAVSGGTTPYTYTWNTGSTAANLTSLAAATYSVTVTDNHACKTGSSYTITQPAALALSGITANALCNGGSGTVTLTVSGGTTPYSYHWNNGATGSILSATAATYTTTVTDANSCSISGGYTITQPTVLSVSAVVTNESCNGASTGVITTTVTGGTPTYSYAWSNGSVAASPSGLAAGTYLLTLTDHNSCSQTASYTVTQPAGMTIATTITNVKCYGAATGSVTIRVSGGASPYTYRWSTGATTTNITARTAGTYTLTVTDHNGCTAIKAATITQPAAPLGLTAVVTNVNCYGQRTGSIVTTVTGGTTPYSYAWTGGRHTSSITSLARGTYNLTVTDRAACRISASYRITQPSRALAVAATITNVSCNGGTDGGINATATGGTTAYSYAWSNGATIAHPIGLSSGLYSLTVTDHNSCTAHGSYTVMQPTAIAVAATITNVKCHGASTGAITITVSGGTAAYTYSWSDGSAAGSRTALAAGTYTLTVTDAKGCTKTVTYTITQPAAGVSISATVTNVSCHGGSDGGVSTSVSGGTTPYTYAWTGGSTGSSISSKIAGTYNLTVTDGNTCTATGSYVITQPAAIAVSATTGNVLCNGGVSGSITPAVTGGTTPYLYLWSNSSTDENQSGLTAGTYSITVTDVHGCTGTGSYTLTQPAALSITPTITNVGCYGSNNGAISITVAGGTLAYSYSWSNGSTARNQASLAPGTFTVIVTDGHSCTQSGVYTVTQPVAPLSLSAVVTNVACHGGATGSVVTTVTGGTSPYTYSWTGGGPSRTSLIAGTYNLTVTDAHGCTTTGSYVVTQPAALTFSAVVSNVSCNGLSDGSINTTVGGGTTPYSYSWSNSSTAADPAGLPSGSYNVTVTDAQSCTITGSYSVTQPAVLSVTGSVTNLTCGHTNNGAISITPSGGTTAYTYSWSNGSTAKNQAGLVWGSYTVTVTDAHSCTTTGSYFVHTCTGGRAEGNDTAEVAAATTEAFKVFPNPGTGLFNVVIPSMYAEAGISITDLTGRTILQTQVTENTGEPVQVTLNNAAAGVYIIKINAGDKNFVEKLIKN